MMPPEVLELLGEAPALAVALYAVYLIRDTRKRMDNAHAEVDRKVSEVRDRLAAHLAEKG